MWSSKGRVRQKKRIVSIFFYRLKDIGNTQRGYSSTVESGGGRKGNR